MVRADILDLSDFRDENFFYYFLLLSMILAPGVIYKAFIKLRNCLFLVGGEFLSGWIWMLDLLNYFSVSTEMIT